MPVIFPLFVSLLPNPTDEQKYLAVRQLLLDRHVADELVGPLAEMLEVLDSGVLYVSGESIDRLKTLLEDLDIPEGATDSPLAVFEAVLTDRSSVANTAETTSAVVFFPVPEAFFGKEAGSLCVVKVFSQDRAEALVQVHSLEDLLDGCSAIVEVEPKEDGEEVKRVLQSTDSITSNCRVALAITDGGTFDLDGIEDGHVIDPAFLLEATRKTPSPSEGKGGCMTGTSISPSLLLLLTPLLLLLNQRKR